MLQWGIARQQRARSFELRATTSLAQLPQRQGRGDGARRRLASLSGWSPEGHDMEDLKWAKALLDGLRLDFLQALRFR